MEIIRDVTFDEEETLKRSRKCQHEEVYEEGTPPRNVEATFLPEDEAPKNHDMTEPQEPPTMEMSRKRKPAWAREIIQEAEKYGVLIDLSLMPPILCSGLVSKENPLLEESLPSQKLRIGKMEHVKKLRMEK